MDSITHGTSGHDGSGYPRDVNAPKIQPDDGQANRRDRILQAAVEEFANKGEAAVRMDEIARLGRVNKQLIYYYFESKSNLYTAVLQQMVERNVGLWEDMAKSELFDGVRRLLSAKQDDGIDWSRLLAWEGIEYGKSKGSKSIVLQSRRTKAYSHMSDLFRRAQATGDLDSEIDPEMLTIAFTLVTMSKTLLPQVVEMVTGLDPTSKEYEERMESFLLDLMHHLGPNETSQD
ncbi:TetR/AcrR family transcriptional regulator [Nocardia fluminea]|uniref:TetR/AcrR family transcriptional regulator n=1 Tax=Nocardia fluminea TaxID=134984 RepID=UPI003445A049